MSSPVAIAGSAGFALNAELAPIMEPLGGLGRAAVRPRTNRVADETTKAVLYNARQAPVAFLVCASPVAPDLIARAVCVARETHRVLGEDLGRAVLLPIASGSADGLSYAIFPYCKTACGRRIIERVRARLVAPQVLRWLRKGTRASVAEPSGAGVQCHFLEPLEAIASDATLRSTLRLRARAAQDRILAGRWRPLHVMEHNDLWIGNVVLGRSLYPLGFPQWDGFALTDWAGGSVRGHAMYDLVRVADSINMRPARLKDEITFHCRVLECDPADAEGYLLAALGALGANLGSFPRARYIELSHRCFRLVSAALAT